MRRLFIVKNDTTTAGGTILTALGEGFPKSTIKDMFAVCEGDQVWCPRCKRAGTVIPDSYYPPVRLKGRLRARHGDRVACGCPGGTYLLAVSQDFCWHDDGEPHPMLAAMREAEAARAAREQAEREADMPRPFDERVQLSTSLPEGLPYYIVMSDGRTLFGRVGNDGLLPRMGSDEEGEYSVYWGDEALAMAQSGGR